MGLETATYISSLVATNPLGSDNKSVGDDHIRLIKSTILATLPNLTGAMTATHTEVNYVAGVTSAIQTQINLKAPSSSPTFTGVPLGPTAAAGTNTTQIATTAFCVALAFNAALPSQAGNSGKIITTNGTTASWSAIGAAGQILQVNSAGTGLTGVALPMSPAATIYSQQNFGGF